MVNSERVYAERILSCTSVYRSLFTVYACFSRPLLLDFDFQLTARGIDIQAAASANHRLHPIVS
jgi:hypothetical protein